MMTRQSPYLFGMIAWACVGACAALPAQTAEVTPALSPIDLEGAELQQKVIAGIRENYARIPALRCKIEMTLLTAGIKERKVLRFKTASGGEVELTETPKTSQVGTLIVSGDDFRVDAIDQETEEHSTHMMRKGIWTSYSPERKWAARWLRPDIGGASNLDPRNFGASGQREIFLHELGEYRVVKHETLLTSNGERLSLHMERAFPNTKEIYKSRWEFDPRRNYLLTRTIPYHTGSDKIVSVYDLEYQEVLPNKAWFLSKSIRKFFGRDGATKLDQDYSQQETVEVKGPVKIEESIPDSEFELSIEPGIFVRDNTKIRRKP